MNNRQINRRNFLRISAVAGAGAVLIPAESKATAAVKSVAGQSSATDIAVRTLGRTGLQMPILSMGVMRADNPSVLRAAYNSGIRHFDTAHGYQNGKNEEMVGTFFADKPRDSVIIATKVKFDYPLKDDFEEKFEADVETSLKRLKMTYVDLFYIHAITGAEPIRDARVVAALKKVKESGKARFIGLSTHDGKNIEQIDAAVESGIYDMILISYNFKLNNLDGVNAAIERAAKAGIGFVAMKTMTGGVEDADGKKKIDAKACLKWVWQNKNFTTIIPGFTNYDELDECVAAVQSPELDENEKKYLAGLRDCEMLYCQQCGKCLAQCPEHLPIPDIMRAYMYSFGYKFSSLSKETLAELHLPDNVCTSCKGSSCKVDCPSGFRVGDKIAAVMPVRYVPDIFLC
ncbi:MAG: aldo/keto reductase [Tannerella sp.]|jgi:aryl-alcohol dehydrogenase-like predicted oxidoreductase|nr:aldo/keto reductase [Tannerella sp.]